MGNLIEKRVVELIGLDFWASEISRLAKLVGIAVQIGVSLPQDDLAKLADAVEDLQNAIALARDEKYSAVPADGDVGERRKRRGGKFQEPETTPEVG